MIVYCLILFSSMTRRGRKLFFCVRYFRGEARNEMTCLLSYLYAAVDVCLTTFYMFYYFGSKSKFSQIFLFLCCHHDESAYRQKSGAHFKVFFISTLQAVNCWRLRCLFSKHQCLALVFLLLLRLLKHKCKL
jgi:hypothetical protein